MKGFETYQEIFFDQFLIEGGTPYVNLEGESYYSLVWKYYPQDTSRSVKTINSLSNNVNFKPEAGRYELFIKDAHSDRYLEFNLAPNGAWWSAEFTSPRVKADNEDIPIVGVRTYAKISGDGCWQAAASIPLSFLESDFSFGQGSRINVTFIVDSPEQKFLSVAELRGAKPDFHQPHCFNVVELNA